ncbi:hypothetical protein Mboo_0912 [Methanoregula boonei 6A8]|uniref:Uncharacterized protein n=1 Tax=Methanoregula boonei (strain DSM 21154 / JCM 14090 / 6A8) TaxID=456442 RepID=A7I6R9_METB6|nr:hypothetical protein Mboo_0912 [Methanoregula boonei 6A8]
MYENDMHNRNTVLDDKIRNRESWFKLFLWGIISLFLVISLLLFVYNIVIGNFKFDFTDLRFSDLLSLSMAIFAIFLSIAFYFKASETSNIFYNNTYRFTTHVSELLGRIEAGFEEKLRHIDEGQSDLKESVEKLPSYMKGNPESTKKEISEESKNLQKELDARNTMIHKLVEKTTLQEHEKLEAIRQLQEREKAIDEMKKQISHLQRRLDMEQNNSTRNRRGSSLGRMSLYLVHNLDHTLHLSREKIKDMPLEELRYRFEEKLLHFDPDFVRDMKINNFVDEYAKLTPSGINFLSNAITKM